VQRVADLHAVEQVADRARADQLLREDCQPVDPRIQPAGLLDQVERCGEVGRHVRRRARVA
jgi:hypothetical protein